MSSVPAHNSFTKTTCFHRKYIYRKREKKKKKKKKKKKNQLYLSDFINQTQEKGSVGRELGLPQTYVCVIDLPRSIHARTKTSIGLCRPVVNHRSFRFPYTSIHSFICLSFSLCPSVSVPKTPESTICFASFSSGYCNFGLHEATGRLVPSRPS